MRVSEIGILDLSVNKPFPLTKVRTPRGTRFPLLADDYLEERLDLNKHLIKHSTATYYAQAEGDSMTGGRKPAEGILEVSQRI
jgi:DNA polymerase V